MKNALDFAGVSSKLEAIVSKIQDLRENGLIPFTLADFLLERMALSHLFHSQHVFGVVSNEAFIKAMIASAVHSGGIEESIVLSENECGMSFEDAMVSRVCRHGERPDLLFFEELKHCGSEKKFLSDFNAAFKSSKYSVDVGRNGFFAEAGSDIVLRSVQKSAQEILSLNPKYTEIAANILINCLNGEVSHMALSSMALSNPSLKKIFQGCGCTFAEIKEPNLNFGIEISSDILGKSMIQVFRKEHMIDECTFMTGYSIDEASKKFGIDATDLGDAFLKVMESDGGMTRFLRDCEELFDLELSCVSKFAGEGADMGDIAEGKTFDLLEESLFTAVSLIMEEYVNVALTAFSDIVDEKQKENEAMRR